MKNIMKFKLRGLLSASYLTICTVLLLVMLNFSAVVNSGVLFSGGGLFNTQIKYSLIINNYGYVASFYGLLMAVVLGANAIGPDVGTGNIYVLLTAYPSRGSYYIWTVLTVWLYMLAVQLFMLANALFLLTLFGLPVIWSDMAALFFGVLLNSTVLMTVTSIASIYMKGYSSIVAGLLAYTYSSLYLYNRIPFVNGSLTLGISQYKDILCNLLPIQHIAAPSVSDPANLLFYAVAPIIPNVSLYQLLYAALTLTLGCLLFRRRQFS
jgi:hypothetical protein